jgi:hypothetical protein
MKRVGTITAAAGLIFLGVWMIALRANPQLGDLIFNWWPALIVVLGVEVLLYGSLKHEERRTRFNFLVIPIIIIFIAISMFQGIVRRLSDFKFDGIGNLNDFIQWGEDLNKGRYREISVSKKLESSPRTIVFTSNNTSLDIRKSSDGKLGIEGIVHVDKSWSGEGYEIKEQNSGDITNISLTEGHVRMVKLTLYVADGMNLTVNGANLKFTMDNELKLSKIDIKGNNSSITASNAEDIIIKSNNDKIDLRNIKNINIDSNNPSISIEGNAERVKINGDNGKVDLKNLLCRDIYIEMNNGKIDFVTKDKNLNLDIKLDSGYYEVNGEKKINSDLSRKFGTGEGIVRIEIDNGVVNFSNQE